MEDQLTGSGCAVPQTAASRQAGPLAVPGGIEMGLNPRERVRPYKGLLCQQDFTLAGTLRRKQTARWETDPGGAVLCPGGQGEPHWAQAR